MGQNLGVEWSRTGGMPIGGPLPDDGVHAPYLWCTLEDTQRLGKGMALVS